MYILILSCVHCLLPLACFLDPVSKPCEELVLGSCRQSRDILTAWRQPWHIT